MAAAAYTGRLSLSRSASSVTGDPPVIG